MKSRIKIWIVDALETTCSWIDVAYALPVIRRVPLGHHCQLATWSESLDERWETNRWGNVSDE